MADAAAVAMNLKRGASPSRDGDAGAGPSKEAKACVHVDAMAAARRRCTHSIVYPDTWDEAAIAQYTAAAQARPLPSKPAKEYPFALDAFQATAAECLEKGQSVLVAAHTSAGKTVVAQYAFAMALRCVTAACCLYTAVVKARGGYWYSPDVNDRSHDLVVLHFTCSRAGTGSA
jgi:ATP-dependent RNA helicase DOB1